MRFEENLSFDTSPSFFPAGAYGQVWKCLDKETGQMVAMKRFKEVRAQIYCTECVCSQS
jgi:hypothetical protein